MTAVVSTSAEAFGWLCTAGMLFVAIVYAVFKMRRP
jgi:hypothetical protein